MYVSKLWGVSILSAGEDSGVISLVHEGPVSPLVPRASLGAYPSGVWYPQAGYTWGGRQSQGPSQTLISSFGCGSHSGGHVEICSHHSCLWGHYRANDQGRSTLKAGSVPWVSPVWACFVQINCDKTRHLYNYSLIISNKISCLFSCC